MRGAQQPAHLRLADRDVAGRQIEQDLGAGQCRRDARRPRHPQILADLDVKGETRSTGGGEQQVRAERGVVPGDGDRPAGDADARGEMPALVELAVIRQKNLWHDAEQLAAMDRDRAVVKLPMRAQRRADDKHREPVPAGLDQTIDLGLDRVEQRILKQQIVDRIGREAQLGEHHQPDPRRVALGEQRLDRLGIMGGLGHRHMGHAGADADELMPVGRKERGHCGRRSRSADRVNLGNQTLYDKGSADRGGLPGTGGAGKMATEIPKYRRTKQARRRSSRRRLSTRDTIRAGAAAPAMPSRPESPGDQSPAAAGKRSGPARQC